MSLSETELIYLMAYVDGQVDDDELPEVMEFLAGSEEARQIVAQHAAMGDWVRESSDARASAAGADGIAAQVLGEIEKLGGGKVIGIERERARVALNRQRVKEFGAILAFAVAAGVFWLMPTSKPEPVAVATHPSARSPVVAPVKTPASASPNDPTAVASGADPAASASGTVAVAGSEVEGAGVDVQSVESPDHPFSIFYVPAATGLNAHSSSVVVWIGE